jgi:hypothetical protein
MTFPPLASRNKLDLVPSSLFLMALVSQPTVSAADDLETNYTNRESRQKE